MQGVLWTPAVFKESDGFWKALRALDPFYGSSSEPQRGSIKSFLMDFLRKSEKTLLLFRNSKSFHSTNLEDFRSTNLEEQLVHQLICQLVRKFVRE